MQGKLEIDKFKERTPWNISYFQFDGRAKFLTQNLVIRQTFILDLQSRNLGRGDLCAEIQIELGSHRRQGGKIVISQYLRRLPADTKSDSIATNCVL